MAKRKVAFRRKSSAADVVGFITNDDDDAFTHSTHNVFLLLVI